MDSLPLAFRLAPDVRQTLQTSGPVVALESTVITHGLPYPENLALAENMEKEVRQAGAVPATVAVIDGKVHLGIEGSQRARLARAGDLRKISVRDIGPAIAAGESGGTTVAGTIFAASKAGIRVLATGGIGGVHRFPPYDISTDLYQLARTPMIVICAGAKAILDLPATLETLETLAVPVIGYRTETFPAFYSADSGLPLSHRASGPEDVAALAQAHWALGVRSAVLVAVPPPASEAIPKSEAESAIEQALAEAEGKALRGQEMTPFLLERVVELTGGASLRANLGLLQNNARVAAQIAVAWSDREIGSLI